VLVLAASPRSPECPVALLVDLGYFADTPVHIAELVAAVGQQPQCNRAVIAADLPQRRGPQRDHGDHHAKTRGQPQ
jgi:hypothetical protein